MIIKTTMGSLDLTDEAEISKFKKNVNSVHISVLKRLVFDLLIQLVKVRGDK